MAQPFLVGVNYPAPGIGRDFSGEQIESDFSRVAGLGAKAVRVLLPWRELQPDREKVSDQALRQLESLLDLAGRSDLRVLLVFFCARLGGRRWLPHWMIEPSVGPEQRPRDFYRDGDLVRAQQLQIRIVAGAFARHKALLGWDLGRETSSQAPAPDPETGRSWLLRLVEALKKMDEEHAATFSLAQADLEGNRGFRPSKLVEGLEFLSVQACPAEATWARSPMDSDCPAFLCHLVRALGGKPVLLSELGLPNAELEPAGVGAPPGIIRSEEEGGRFLEDSPERARREGALGAFAWCLADSPDYAEELPHERFFGLFRSDGSAKPAAHAFSRFASRRPGRVEAPSPAPLDEVSFYADPARQIRAAFDEFIRARASGE